MAQVPLPRIVVGSSMTEVIKSTDMGFQAANAEILEFPRL